MHTGSELLETWIPDGGFMIERRKLKAADGGSALADCLVPKWADDELTRDLPCARQPCLHRIFAECPPDPERILALAGRYGLLTLDPTLARAKPDRESGRAPARAGRDLEKGDSGATRLHGTVGFDCERSGIRSSARTARPQTLRAPGPHAVPSQDFRPELPLLPANVERRAMATLRRRSRRSHSPRPLRRSQLWPLVPR
jgi:hypothetical protein